MSTSDDLLSYYHAVATRHPKAAARLELSPEECPDPHVERLIESVAFLRGRVRRGIEAYEPRLRDVRFQAELVTGRDREMRVMIDDVMAMEGGGRSPWHSRR